MSETIEKTVKEAVLEKIDQRIAYTKESMEYQGAAISATFTTDYLEFVQSSNVEAYNLSAVLLSDLEKLRTAVTEGSPAVEKFVNGILVGVLSTLSFSDGLSTAIKAKAQLAMLFPEFFGSADSGIFERANHWSKLDA